MSPYGEVEVPDATGHKQFDPPPPRGLRSCQRLQRREHHVTQRRRQHRRQNRNMRGQARSGRRSTSRSVPPVTRQEQSVVYRPRDDRPPEHNQDLIDRHVSRATESDSMSKRYILLIREFRNLIWIIVFSVLLLAGGISAAVAVAGVSPWVATGAAVAGAGTATVIGARVAGRRYRA